MAISAKDVMALRARTGVGMMECKKALAEADGDSAKAIEILREKLKGKMDERTDRAAGEGALAIAKGDGAVALIELKAESDFTARNDAFVDAAQKIADIVLAGPEGETTTPTAEATELIDNLRITTKENISFARGIKLVGSKVGGYVHFDRKTGSVVAGEGDLDDKLMSGISMHVTASVPTPMGVDQDSLPADKVEAAKQEAIQEAKDSGKPDEIAEKIATGKLRKWVDDNSLMGQIYLPEMDAKKPIRDFMPKGSKITAFVRYQVGETGASEE